ncbi:MAG: protease, partial [bacterium]
MLSTAITALLSFVVPGSLDTVEPRLLRFPTVYKDTVVFSYAGDLWVAKTDAGAVARRLTSNPGLEIRPRISPDGQWVAFTGNYDGSNNVYVIPIEGGEPKRLTYSTEGDNCLGWTPDGKVMYASATGNIVPDQYALYMVDPKGGPSKITSLKECTSASMFPDGHRVAITRVRSFDFNWRRYRGGTQGRVGIYDLDSHAYSELPSGREQSFHPMVVGDDIYYISDRNTGTLNLYRHRGSSDEKLTDFTASDIRYPSTDGENIVFENDGYLYEYNIASKGTTKLSPRILSENLTARPRMMNLAPRISSGTLSPSGARIAVEARGELFSIPAKKGEVRNMSRTSGVRERSPKWSPDGKTIAYLSDASGEYELYTQPQLGGDASQITTGSMSKINNFMWTPDSKSILFFTNDNDMCLLDVATKKVTKIDHTEYGYGGIDIAPNSKWIAYASATHASGVGTFIYDVTTGKS